MILLFVFGCVWGFVIGMLLTLWASWRYAGDLHERLMRLERRLTTAPPLQVFMPTTEELDALNKKVFADIAAMLEAEDDDEDVVIH